MHKYTHTYNLRNTLNFLKTLTYQVAVYHGTLYFWRPFMMWQAKHEIIPDRVKKIKTIQGIWYYLVLLLQMADTRQPVTETQPPSAGVVVVKPSFREKYIVEVIIFIFFFAKTLSGNYWCFYCIYSYVVLLQLLFAVLVIPGIVIDS